MKVMVSVTFIILLGYLCAAGFLFTFQRNFLYFPTKKIDHPFERFGIASQGEAVEVVVLNRGNRKALVYFGGNGEAVVANAGSFLSTFPDVTIYLVNYRGYGGSSGEPTESGIFADALAVYDEVKGLHSHISVMGRSLGSGVAMYLAANRAVEKIALVTPYDSILNIAKSNYPIFPVRFLLKDHYDSLSRAKNIKSNVLVIAAEHDQIINMTHTQNLIDAFEIDQVTVRVIEDAGHNSLSNEVDYYKTLGDFI